jgi:PleD family two-component response regulator
MSVGVASVPENGHSIDELIATADKALYRAKSAGRNRVVIAEPQKRLQPVPDAPSPRANVS